MKIQALREKYTELVNQARNIMDNAGDKVWSKDDQTKYDDLIDQAERVKAQIAAVTRVSEEEKDRIVRIYELNEQESDRIHVYGFNLRGLHGRVLLDNLDLFLHFHLGTNNILTTL